jgi:Fe-S-cluster containining protein
MSEQPASNPTPAYLETCLRCGECCTRYQVLLGESEMRKMADYLGLSAEDFKKDYTDPRWPITEKYLLRHRANGGCIFLVHQGKEALCSIHVAKPQACRDWSPSLARKECSSGLARVWHVAIKPDYQLSGEERDLQAFTDYLKSLD